MPARSKPRATSRRTVEPSDDLLIAENSILKLKNSELARALTECKLQCARLIRENSNFQQQLFGSDCENSKMRECFKRIDSWSRSSLDHIVSLSRDITSIVHNSMYFLQPAVADCHITSAKKNLNVSENSQNLSINKTRAVKPMVSGHTILSPTINLQRVSKEQMAHLMNNLDGDESTDSDEIPNDEPRASLHSSLERQTQEARENGESFEDSLSPQLSDDAELELSEHHRLNTVQEEDEDVTLTPLIIHRGRLRSHPFELVEEPLLPSKRHCGITVGSERNSPVPCIESNSMMHCSERTHSSSDTELNSMYSSQHSNKTIQHSTHTSEDPTNMMYDCTTVADDISLRNIRTQKSIDLTDDHNNSDIIPEDVLANLKNISTIVNSNLDMSDYQNNLSIISSKSVKSDDSSPEHFRQQLTNQSAPRSYNNANSTLISSYDPLEGPSTLLDKVRQPNGKESNMIRSSTPYSPMNISRRKNYSKQFDSYPSFIATPDISKVSPPSKVTRRKIKTENLYQSHHLLSCHSDEVSLPQFRNCSVRISKLPHNKLSIKCGEYRQMSEVPPPQLKRDRNNSIEEVDTSNSTSNDIHWRLDIRCGPNSSNIKEGEPMKTPKLEKRSPHKRLRRNLKVPNLKEPSLRKKLRRSR